MWLASLSPLPSGIELGVIIEPCVGLIVIRAPGFSITFEAGVFLSCDEQDLDPERSGDPVEKSALPISLHSTCRRAVYSV